MAKRKTNPPNETRGIHVSRLNYIMAFIIITVSALLLISTFYSGGIYTEMFDNTENYIKWQRSAFELELASDYLTEQVRCFAVTGEIQYMQNYFQEANVTKRRDNALNTLRKNFDGTETFSQLEAAMNSSVRLMDREFYSMRLTCEGYKIDMTEVPDEIRATELLPTDKTLSAAKKKELARSMVFDEIYKEQKERIYAQTNACLDGLVNTTEVLSEDSLKDLKTILTREQVLILVMVAVVAIIILVTTLLLISPLMRAIANVRAGKPMPETGSYEFRYLARTYNLMFQTNRGKSEHLLYDSMHDKLTDVYNRSGYDFLLKNTERSDCTFVIFNIDSFRSVNENYGHDIGDKVLAKVADTLKSSFRSQDYICRVGGDEFVVIMVNANSSIEELLIRKIDSINDRLMNPTDGLPPVSVSAGIAYGNRNQSVKDADNALRKVKAVGGRGCKVAE